MVEGGAVDPARELFIAPYARAWGLAPAAIPGSPSRPEADFSRCLAGGQKSRLLVHERYELERVTSEILAMTPIQPPAVDSDASCDHRRPRALRALPDAVGASLQVGQ